MALPQVRARRRPSPNASQLELRYGGSGNQLFPSPRNPPAFYHSFTGPNTEDHDNEFRFYQNIQILPTADEIFASTRIYLPLKNLSEPHEFAPGIDRLLDTSFRHLRFEHTEKIRDIAYHAAQQAFISCCQINGYMPDVSEKLMPRAPPVRRPESSYETPCGNRYFMYKDARVEELISHDTLSIIPRISFPCPADMRGRAIFHSGRFDTNMLVALMCLDVVRNEVEIYYLQIHMLESTDSMAKRDPTNRRAAIQASFLPDTPMDTVKFFARLAQKLEPHIRMCLVEFPKVLYAGFYNCLHRLQNLQGFAFSNLIAPALTNPMIHNNMRTSLASGKNGLQYCRPPAYAREYGFEYHLQSILNADAPESQASFTLGELADPSAVTMVDNFTTLDRGQAAALRHSLLSEIAFTQGPPGTGELFVWSSFSSN
jgi:hypothetical protein